MARSNEVYNYLEGILRDAGKADLPSDSKGKAIQQLASALYAIIEDTNLRMLSSNDLDSYLQLFERGSTRQEREQFLMSRIPDYQAVLDNVFDEFHTVAIETLKGADVESTNLTKSIE